MRVILGIVVVLVILWLLIMHWQLVLLSAVVALLALVLPKVIRTIRKDRYFLSDDFLAHKHHIAAIVADHNEIASYATEIRNQGSFQLQRSAIGNQSHLATFENTSNHNYRRDRHTADYLSPNVHNSSLQVVRNASSDPLKYLMKYFGIKANEAHLADVESLGDDIARLEGAIGNLHERELTG